ncbi:uncharacterized protein TrAtP1_006810 [Trichoderma atroviride]|uniref:Nephrocystin 3-like N-terminal domain-containing protein n=1 Tax=Hypocrea atroviridis (strain ATCC 20476 / IMI 206040) TaxID=452589 RepID=G9PBD4_HYPAI|nr:uncharacterized protein TRIATDRAFT_133230 [Trichoderma atroviride IMI 206040]EHK39681.1 hypothetical protein TRIATDRAFT_133230 [Trichoderma atroviride IMI 206040]UKZ65614.1 hypothetical protein TrAtP1_006810 [Trichoderma atroviride]
MEGSRNFSGNTVGDNAEVILGNTQVTVNTTTLDDDRIFLQEFSQIDPVYTKKDILMRKGPLLRDTCRWILDHEAFKRWYCTRPKGVLWIKGDPGKGKTMLLCGIIEKIEEFEQFKISERWKSLKIFRTLEELEELEKLERPANFSEFKKSQHFDFEENTNVEGYERFGGLGLLEQLGGEPGRRKKFEKFEEHDIRLPSDLLYFFCQATDFRTNTAAAVIRGLIFIMLKPRPALLKLVREKYGDGPKGQLIGDKALAILCDMFETIVRALGRIDEYFICVVDALDECIEDCDHLLNLIIKTSDTVQWLVSSRSEKHIERKLTEISQKVDLELGQNAEQVSVSVDMYINLQIQEISAIQDDEDLQSKTSKILKSKASGTFLWAALVIEQLRDTDHWQVEDVLKEIPEGLESIYCLLLNRIDKLKAKAREACQALLSVVATAMRPLHLTELLLFINAHWKDDKRFKTSFQPRDIRDMAKDCGSILSIRGGIVYFVHQSAKDYIVEAAARLIFPIQHQHYKMFEISLDVMSSNLTYNIYGLTNPQIYVDDISHPTVDPLASLRYCCTFWVEHLAQGFEHFEDGSSLHSFLTDKFLCWVESLALKRNYILHTLPAVQKLKRMIDSCCESGSMKPQIGHLRQFLDDACRFLTHSTTWVPHWPLQLYFLAIEFEPEDSVIKKTFNQTVRDRFGSLPAAFQMFQMRQSPLQRRAITFTSKLDDRFLHHYLIFSPSWCPLHLKKTRPILTYWNMEEKCSEDGEEVDEKMPKTTFPGLGHRIYVPREGVMASRGFHSYFNQESLDLNRGPYQGHGLHVEDPYTYPG